MGDDFSKDIFDIWFGKGKVLRIHLKNDGVVEGVLVGFYHHDEDDSYITEWEFVNEDDYNKKASGLEIPDSLKVRIRQEDILTIDFKYNEGPQKKKI